MKKHLYAIFLMFFTWAASAQSIRYLEEVYDTVKITKDIVYGENATVLYLEFFGQAIKEPLLLDLYEPVSNQGEQSIARPLIIYFHSGNFLPFPQNQNVVGTRKDSSVVEMCRRLAKCGYVVASADYRLGWNPLATSVDDRKLGLINAAYRGVQDANTCIRYFKKAMVESLLPVLIDTSRIILWGDDSGGYLALNAGCLDRYEKIPLASDGKFWYAGLFPMVIESLNGDVEAKQYGINSPAIPGLPYPEGDTLCYVNHPEYSSKFSVTVNMSGAVGDSAWIEEGQPPVISVHAPYDLTTPYEEGIVYVNIGEEYLEVIEVQGSSLVNSLSTQLGNNEGIGMPANATPFQQAVSDVAYARNGGREALYPIIGDTITDANPWIFWDCESNVNCTKGLEVNPHMSREKAKVYADTILAYVLPRLYNVLDLQTVATKEVLMTDERMISISPNPASDAILVSTEQEKPIRGISVFDMRGVLVHQYTNLQTSSFRMPVNRLVSGQYILKLLFDDGIVARMFIVN